MVAFGTRVEQIDIPTDKASIIAILNGAEPPYAWTTSRQWEFTSRGGMTEIDDDGNRLV